MPANPKDFGFSVGDRVVVTEPQDDCPKGEIGVVVALIDFMGGGKFEPWIWCRMESDGCDWQNVIDIYTDFSADREGTKKILHDNGWTWNDRAYWGFQPDRLKKFAGVYKPKVNVCDVCGARKSASKMVRSKKGKYVCKECLRVKSYSTKNDTRVGKDTKAGWTFGFEFECIPKSEEDEAVLVSKKWGFIPTSDGSLPTGGVELKSPTICGRTSLKRMFDAANESVDFSHSSCGQHINVGNRWMDKTTMNAIRSRANKIFSPMERYMNDHESDTRRVCGRFFGNYRERVGGGNSYRHGCWVNLDHDNRVEFRISKFKTPEQYFALCNMWCEVLEEVRTGYLMKGCSEEAATKVGQNLVKIFQKHAG